MIARLSGKLEAKSPTEIVLDVGGVAFALSIPLSTFERLAEPGTAISLYTHLHVRDDALQLYGFFTEEERDIFRLLISVNGIGPKMAQGILSGIGISDLQGYILSGNSGALTSIPGVGRKTAERLVVELRDKISRAESAQPATGIAPGSGSSIRTEALLALTSLGYSRQAAEKAVRGAMLESPEAEASVESLIKAALRHATQQT
jgi:Holliday junction DNA helicase RuvA